QRSARRAGAPDGPAASEAFELIGRDAEIQAVSALVDNNSLVSIIGTGGVGKTSLARAVLANHIAGNEEEVHWIDAAPLRDIAQLVRLMAKTLAIDLSGLS